MKQEKLKILSQPSHSDTIKLYHWGQKPVVDFDIIKFRQRSKPTDTPIIIHTTINHYAKQRFNLPIRNLFFTYTTKKDEKANRVIPIGNNVTYYYHPEVEDMTEWSYGIIRRVLNEYLKDNDTNIEINELLDDIERAITIKSLLDDIDKQYDNAEDVKNVFALIVRELKRYVYEVIKVTDIEMIHKNTYAEVMIYAPDDLYILGDS